ncbi:lytic murein transglycosylase [Nocardioides sp. J54]|uniref:lytic murein transglycosylase n=1 Tax=Nocardioides sp. J54 TaxID=935866 RepID=UPI0012FBA6CE|nr:lytic murein transglycosylase [Nocardioides sp. J54]
MAANQQTRTRRMARLAALGPLTLVSAAWTLSVAGAGALPAPTVTAGSAGPAEAAEPAVEVPADSVEAPASPRGSATPGPRTASGGGRVAVVAARSGTSVPAPAMAAYQRAAAIMRGADEDCGLEWPLLAAIGSVESGHGTAGGSALDDDGVATPPIIGIRLDGRRGTAQISDTDGGRYDGDRAWDRAVGPMQFIPTTWGIVGVDADNDGQRNPQDVDDAALAAAVYLCSGDADLRQPGSARRAVLRYNQSSAYADQVLALARSYAAGSSVPLAAGIAVRPTGTVPAAGSTTSRDGRGGTDRGIRAAAQPARGGPGSAKGSDGSGGAPASSTPRTGKPSGGDGDRAKPAPKPTPKPAPKPAAKDVLAPLAETLDCTVRNLDKLLQPDGLAACLAKLGGR